MSELNLLIWTNEIMESFKEAGLPEPEIDARRFTFYPDTDYVVIILGEAMCRIWSYADDRGVFFATGDDGSRGARCGSLTDAIASAVTYFRRVL